MVGPVGFCRGVYLSERCVLDVCGGCMCVRECVCVWSTVLHTQQAHTHENHQPLGSRRFCYLPHATLPQALWSNGTNTSTPTSPAPSAAFQVQLPGTSTWLDVCAAGAAGAIDAASNANCVNDSCDGARCPYTYTVASTTASQYTLQFRATLSGSPGSAVPVSWSYVLCGPAAFAVLNDTDCGVTCAPCPDGGNCAVADVTQQRDIVAQPGYWAPPLSSGLEFYRCPIPEACVPGDNGTTRSVCAPGYSAIACR